MLNAFGICCTHNAYTHCILCMSNVGVDRGVDARASKGKGEQRMKANVLVWHRHRNSSLYCLSHCRQLYWCLTLEHKCVMLSSLKILSYRHIDSNASSCLRACVHQIEHVFGHLPDSKTQGPIPTHEVQIRLIKHLGFWLTLDFMSRTLWPKFCLLKTWVSVWGPSNCGLWWYHLCSVCRFVPCRITAQFELVQIMVNEESGRDDSRVVYLAAQSDSSKILKI